MIRTHALPLWQVVAYATLHLVAQMAAHGAHPKKIRIDVLDTLGAWVR